MRKNKWQCLIGEIDGTKLPHGSDLPMRLAVKEAYRKLTGEDPVFIFSGWGAELTETQREVVDEKIKRNALEP